MNNLNFLNLQRITFTLIGEIHGIKENVEVLKFLIKLYLKENDGKLILGFEWPIQLTSQINSYLKNRNDLNWCKWNFVKYKDGRISKEHIDFLKWIKKINLRLPEIRKIKIQCFDVVEKQWNKRDKKMADVFLRKNRYKKVKIIAIMGNLHARKKEFFLNRKKYIPLGSYLPKHKTLTIKLEYISGYFCNEFVKKILPTKKINIISKLVFQKTREFGYDYILFIKKAHPIKLL